VILFWTLYSFCFHEVNTFEDLRNTCAANCLESRLYADLLFQNLLIDSFFQYFAEAGEVFTLPRTQLVILVNFDLVQNLGVTLQLVADFVQVFWFRYGSYTGQHEVQWAPCSLHMPFPKSLHLRLSLPKGFLCLRLYLHQACLRLKRFPELLAFLYYSGHETTSPFLHCSIPS
jgi:hypothetical protein